MVKKTLLNSLSSPLGSCSERRDQQPSYKCPPCYITLLLVHFQPSNSFLLCVTSSFSVFVVLFFNCSTLS